MWRSSMASRPISRSTIGISASVPKSPARYALPATAEQLQVRAIIVAHPALSVFIRVHPWTLSAAFIRVRLCLSVALPSVDLCAAAASAVGFPAEDFIVRRRSALIACLLAADPPGGRAAQENEQGF